MLDTKTYLNQDISIYNEFEFLYYENAGELVGSYKYRPRLVRDARDYNSWVDTESKYVVSDISKIHYIFQNVPRVYLPSFFNDKYFRTTPIKREQSDRIYDFLNQKTSWPNSITATPVMRLQYKYYENHGSRIYTLDNEGYEPNVPDELINYHILYLGEFFLINDTIRAIKKVNLKSELLIDEKNSLAYSQYNRLPTFTDEMKYRNESFLKWYFGICFVSDRYKNKELYSMNNIYPDINNFIHAENRQGWNMLRGNCMSWMRIYDNYDFEFTLNHDNYNNKKVPTCAMKVHIDFDKLRRYLDSLNIFNIEADYGEGNDIDNKMIDLIIYPPSMYNYPVQQVNNIIKPIVNQSNEAIREVLFKVPNTIKSDGNIHFEIKFYGSNNRLIFITSSEGSNINYQKNSWFWSKTNKGPWERINNGDISFDNRYSNNSGIDIIFAKYIRYILPEKYYDMIKDEPVLSFEVLSSDGTRVFESNSVFNIKYKVIKQ